jgi:hypothetical protein
MIDLALGGAYHGAEIDLDTARKGEQTSRLDQSVAILQMSSHFPNSFLQLIRNRIRAGERESLCE